MAATLYLADHIQTAQRQGRRLTTVVAANHQPGKAGSKSDAHPQESLSLASIAEAADQVTGKMRTARHHVGGGLSIVFVARPVMVEEMIQPRNPLGHRLHGLQADRNSVIGEANLT